jgi:NAD(P)H-quinone oxidoreductase subunit 5
MLRFFADTAAWIPLYPLIGALSSLFWSPGGIRLTGPRPAGYTNLVFTTLALLHSILALWGIWGQPETHFHFTWLHSGDLTITFDGTISTLTVAALVLISAMHLLAQLFAVGYLEMDWGWPRLFGFLSFFEAGLGELVLCDSLFFSYVILELLTLGTYLLVGLWYNQPLVATGARDAFLTKRVGDLLLLVAVIALWPLAGSWNFNDLAIWAQTIDEPSLLLNFIGIALIAGPLGKCAQLPLHLWLDEAMEGPLPSTILRNAIVISGGAWVLIRLTPVISHIPVAQSVLIAVGATTAIVAGLIAMAQIDLKRALSYPVSAWMGLVCIAVGLSQSNTALLMLLTYSVAMTVLVMSIGCIIASNVTQNLEQLGGLWSRRPLQGLAFLSGAAGLVALPPLSGFAGLQALAAGIWQTKPSLLMVLLITNGLLTFGLMRVFARVWGGRPKEMTVRSPEVLWPMVLPTMICFGLVLHLPLMLRTVPLDLPQQASLNIPLLWSSILGASLAAVIYFGPFRDKPVQLPVAAVQQFFAQDLYTAKLYDLVLIKSVRGISSLIRQFDRYLLDGLAHGFGLATLLSGESLRYSISGRTQAYVLTILLGLALIGGLVLWPRHGTPALLNLF